VLRDLLAQRDRRVVRSAATITATVAAAGNGER
jgi:hypothetical protein